MAGGIKPSETVQNLLAKDRPLNTRKNDDDSKVVLEIPENKQNFCSLHVSETSEPLRFKEACSLSHPRGPVSKIKSLTAARLISGGVDRCVKLWDLVTEKAIINFPGHPDTISDLEFVSQTRQIISSAGH